MNSFDGLLAPYQKHKKLIIQFQENAWTDRTKGLNSKRMDRPYFTGLFWLLPGIKKKKEERLVLQ